MRALPSALLAFAVFCGCAKEHDKTDNRSTPDQIAAAAAQANSGDAAAKPAPAQPAGTMDPGPAGTMDAAPPKEAAPVVMVKQDPATIKDAKGLAAFLDGVAKGAIEPVPVDYQLAYTVCPDKECWSDEGKGDVFYLAERAVGGTLVSLDQLNADGHEVTTLAPSRHFRSFVSDESPHAWFYRYQMLPEILRQILYANADVPSYFAGTSYAYQTTPLDLAKLATQDELFDAAKALAGDDEEKDERREVDDYGFAFALRDKGYLDYARGVAGTLQGIVTALKLEVPAGAETKECPVAQLFLEGEVQVVLTMRIGPRTMTFLSKQVPGCGFVFARPDALAGLKAQALEKVKGLKAVSGADDVEDEKEE